MSKKKKPFAWLTLMLAFGLVSAACSGDDDEPEATDDGGETPAAVEGCPTDVDGDVIVSGSSTVEPISSKVGELLEECGSGVAATVDGPGTGDGFALFCAGDTDISDASRPISEEEIAQCDENGIEFIELKVAFDGISVLANPANSIECVSFADLYALAGPESEDVDKWSDAQALATELGSTTELPDLDLEMVAPGEESGTYDSFIEIVFGDIAEARVESGDVSEDVAETTRPNYSSQSDDSQIISGIEGQDGGFGWVGFAFAENAGDAVKELAVSAEAGGECIAPTHETIADGSYPISRPLYIYVSKTAAEDSEAVSAYVDYYLAEGIAAVEEVGYVALPADQLAATTAAWDAREVGTREG